MKLELRTHPEITTYSFFEGRFEAITSIGRPIIARIPEQVNIIAKKGTKYEITHANQQVNLINSRFCEAINKGSEIKIYSVSAAIKEYDRYWCFFGYSN